MNKILLLAAAAVALVLVVPSAQAWPPCTCDPNPIFDCLRTGDGCPDPESGPIPEGVDLDDLDPRNEPCTCDPPPAWW